MTENKRFTTVELPKPNRWGIWYDGAYLSTYQVCILLNEYVDVKKENEQLKQTIDGLTLDNTKQKKVLNATKKENKQLKQQLQSIEDNFKFCCTENHIEFDKDEIEVKDTHTELTLKDSKLCISVFIPQINDYFKFFYLVTGRKMDREFINYEGDVE